MGGRDDGAGELSILGADAGEKAGLTSAGSGESLVGDQFDVRVGDVGKSLGGGAGVSAGHVGDAVVENAFFDVDGIIMGSGARCFGATALIDSDIDEDASRAHTAKHGASYELRGFCSWNEDSSDEEIDVGEKFIEVGLIGKKGVGGMHRNIEKAHTFEVDLKDGDIGTEACGHAGGIDS